MVRRVPSKQRNAIVSHQHDHDALKRLVLLLVCGLVLACGFVYAGGQHFAALRFGYQTEKLRTARAELTEEQHRLLLEREAEASPLRLERAARKLGMQPLQATQIEPLDLAAKDKAVTSTEKLIGPQSAPKVEPRKIASRVELHRTLPK